MPPSDVLDKHELSDESNLSEKWADENPRQASVGDSVLLASSNLNGDDDILVAA